jgi:hypothetical protein
MSDLDDLLADNIVAVDWQNEKIPNDGLAAPSPFDFVKSINTKKRIADELIDRFYEPYIINQAFSQHSDTVLFAQELNKLPKLSNLSQYNFLYTTIRKGNRYGKWAKLPQYEHLQMIIDIYQVSKLKAVSILDRLTDENIEDLKAYYDKGGRQLKSTK